MLGDYWDKLAKENFNKWNQALQIKNPVKVAELYTDDNSFLPTLSSDFKSGQEGAESYFRHFLEKNPTGEIIDDRIQKLTSDSYLHSGMYNFTVGHKDDRQIVEARFTFVWVKNDSGEWKIIHHHSSLKPQE